MFQISDEELMLRCRNGEMSAFELIVRRFKDPIINYIHRSIGDFHQAEDLAQETFLRVLRSSARYEPKCKFKNWIYLIATNLCRNEMRNRNRRKTDLFTEIETQNEFDEFPVFPDLRYVPDYLYEKKERKLIVRQQIDQLPENQKLCLILVTYQELSYDEIAEVIGCSVSAVKSLIHRARQNLKKRLIEVGIGESRNAKV